jgi:hypothetical protein
MQANNRHLRCPPPDSGQVTSRMSGPREPGWRAM